MVIKVALIKMFVNIQKIIDFIYPPICYLCKEQVQGKGLCRSCFVALSVASEELCISCGVKIEVGNKCIRCISKSKSFDSFTFCFNYNETIANLIMKIKDQDEINLCSFVANFLSNKLLQNTILLQTDIIIPVPLHWSKLIKRRHNYIALIAKYLSKKSNIYFNPTVLSKVKKTKDQRKLSGKERINNLKVAFNVQKNKIQYIRDKRVLLIDDVVTTGATIHECSLLLKKLGAKEVCVLCIARVDGILKV